MDIAVELHFHVLLLGIQSTENKRKCQKNVPGHCKFPHGTNRPIIKLDCTQGLSSFFHTSVYCKIPSKEYKQREWNGSVAKKSACQTRNTYIHTYFIGSSPRVLLPLLGLVGFVLSCPKFKSTATGCLLPVGVFNPVMLYLNYLLLSSI